MPKIIMTPIAVMLFTLMFAACTPAPTPNELVKETPATPSPAQSSKEFGWTWLDNVVEQPYTDEVELLRKNYMVVLDGSGSMSGERINVAKQAVVAFTKKLTPEDSLGLIVFDNAGTSVRVSLQPDNSAIFTSAVNKVSTGGGTPLADATTYGYKELRTQAAKQRGYGEYHLIIVTDGEANGGQDPGQLVRMIVQGTPINIHSIGFQFSGNHSLNQQGITTYYQADNYDELMNSFTSILAESTSFDVSDFN